jgi:hypothetical protein
LQIGCTVVGIVLALVFGWMAYSWFFPAREIVSLVSGLFVTIVLPLTVLGLTFRFAPLVAKGVRKDQELTITDEKIQFNDESVACDLVAKAVLHEKTGRFNLLLRTKKYRDPKTNVASERALPIQGIERLGDKDEILREISKRLPIPIEGWSLGDNVV